VAGGQHADAEARRPGEFHRTAHVLGILSPDDEGGSVLRIEVPRGPSCVVPVVAGEHGRSAEAGTQPLQLF
jgi:hypothetical protein